MLVETKAIAEFRRDLENAGLKLNTSLKGKIRSEKIWNNLHSVLRLDYGFCGGGGIEPFMGCVGSYNVTVYTDKVEEYKYRYTIRVVLEKTSEA